MQCDMCGSSNVSCIGIVERVSLKLCERCANYAKNVKKIESEQSQKSVKQTSIVGSVEEELVVNDYPKLIKKAREAKGLKQEELGRLIAERESVIGKIESGNFTLDLTLAKKFEKVLNIKLITINIGGSFEPKSKIVSGAYTIGDLLKK